MEHVKIPEGWRYIRLGDICEHTNGVWGTINPEGVPVLRSTDFLPHGALSYQTAIRLNLSERDIRKAALLPGDILLERSGGGPKKPVGRVAYFSDNNLYCFGNFITRLRVSVDFIYPRYLFLYLHQFHILGQTERLQTQTTNIRNLRFGEYLNTSVPVPFPDNFAKSVAEQQRVVARIEALLSEVREMREINHEINRDSSQLLDAILKETFPDFQKQAPNQWTWEPLGERCKTTSGGTPRRGIPEYFNGSIPWIKSGELNDGVILESEEKITQLAIERSNAKLFPVGTLLIAMYGATVGKLGILGLEAATNQAVCAIFPPPEILPGYLFWYLRRLRRELIISSFGGAQPNISQTVIRKIQIPIPFYKEIEKSKTEQLRIVNYLNSISEEIVQIQKSSIHDRDLISQLEQSILAQAFRGEL